MERSTCKLQCYAIETYSHTFISQSGVSCAWIPNAHWQYHPEGFIALAGLGAGGRIKGNVGVLTQLAPPHFITQSIGLVFVQIIANTVVVDSLAWLKAHRPTDGEDITAEKRLLYRSLVSTVIHTLPSFTDDF
jgi:hypothetical protein